MTKPTEEKAMPEALATFAASARNNNVPAGQGVSATPETSGKPGNLAAEEKDAADIIGGNATGDKNRVDAAIDHHAKTDRRAG
jgi:RecJ-like exonuclease